MLEMPELWDTCQGKLVTEWNQPQRKKYVAVNKAERSWRSEESFDIRHEDAEVGVCSAGFSFGLVQYFLTVLPSLHLRMVIYILCYYMLEVCDLHFDFNFIGDYS